MAVLPGFKYDVFISYRQNDNKYDGWVSSFVHNLTMEIEATIKDKLTVYFDINPHDGLLDTYTVDKSLEDKLKCLIFIPILSKTYCDENSFAWQHEFCAFNRQAKNDSIGRDVMLSNGNFAGRILPVKIHELEADDRFLVENELGTSLRSIDFIFRSAGVNRPLRPDEDHPHDNLNSTYYRDQINKVANAISEIISAIRNVKIREAGELLSAETESSGKTSTGSAHKKRRRKTFSTGARILGIFILLITVTSVLIKLFYPEGFIKSAFKKTVVAGKRISITVLPFNNLTNDVFLNYLRVGAQDAVVTSLSFFPEEFNVRPFDIIRKSVAGENLSDLSAITPVNGSRMSKRLDADFFLIGDFLKNGRFIRLNSKLINSKTQEIIRSFQEEGDSGKVMLIIDTLSNKIRSYLLLSKMDKENYQAGRNVSVTADYLTDSPDAYRYHMLAKEAIFNLDYVTALRLDLQAAAIDSTFTSALVSLCWEYYHLGNYEEAQNWLKKALRKRNNLPLIQQVNLDLQNAFLNQTPDEQIIYLKQLQKIEDNNPRYYQMLGYINIELDKFEEGIAELEKARDMFRKLGTEPNDWFYYHYLIIGYNKTGRTKMIKEILIKAEKELIKSSRESKSGDRYYKMAIIYSDAGIYNKADEYFQKGLQLNPGNQGMIFSYAQLLIDNNETIDQGLELINTLLERDSSNAILIDIKGWGLYRKHNFDEALQLLEKAYRMIPSNEIKAQIDSVKKASGIRF